MAKRKTLSKDKKKKFVLTGAFLCLNIQSMNRGLDERGATWIRSYLKENLQLVEINQSESIIKHKLRFENVCAKR